MTDSIRFPLASINNLNKDNDCMNNDELVQFVLFDKKGFANKTNFPAEI